MGYRSSVAIGVNNSVLDDEKRKIFTELDDNGGDPGIEEIKKDGYTVFYFDSIKWYSGYEEIDKIDKFLSELDDSDYAFLRIGEYIEDIEDIEMRGDCYEYSLYVERKISIG